MDGAKLGRKGLMETRSSTACTIDRSDKDHTFAFQVWSKFRASNNKKIFSGIAGKKSITNITSDTFQIVHLGNNESHSDRFNRDHWSETIFFVNRREAVAINKETGFSSTINFAGIDNMVGNTFVSSWCSVIISNGAERRELMNNLIKFFLCCKFP